MELYHLHDCIHCTCLPTCYCVGLQNKTMDCYNSFEEILKGHLDNIVYPYLLNVTTLPMKEAAPVFKAFPEPVCLYLFLNTESLSLVLHSLLKE